MACFKLICSHSERYRDDYARYSLIRYILTKENCVRYDGFGLDPDMASYLMYLTAQSWNKDTQIRIRQWILSFTPEETARMGIDHIKWVTMEQIAREICLFLADEYQIVYAIHEHPTHDHIHLLLNPVNCLTGMKYPDQKQNHDALIRHIKKVLKPYGCPLQVVFD